MLVSEPRNPAVFVETAVQNPAAFVEQHLRVLVHVRLRLVAALAETAFESSAEL